MYQDCLALSDGPLVDKPLARQHNFGPLLSVPFGNCSTWGPLILIILVAGRRTEKRPNIAVGAPSFDTAK